MTTARPNHCQICGRDILANTGVIALHGYKRPHQQGWQTASCMGAKHLPYEVSRDQIPFAIASVKEFIKRHRKHLATLASTPPASYTYENKDAYGRVYKTRTWERPANFEPKGEGYRPWESYEGQYDHEVRDSERHIADAKRQLTWFEERYENWVAPK